MAARFIINILCLHFEFQYGHMFLTDLHAFFGICSIFVDGSNLDDSSARVTFH